MNVCGQSNQSVPVRMSLKHNETEVKLKILHLLDSVIILIECVHVTYEASPDRTSRWHTVSFQHLTIISFYKHQFGQRNNKGNKI